MISTRWDHHSDSSNSVDCVHMELSQHEPCPSLTIGCPTTTTSPKVRRCSRSHVQELLYLREACAANLEHRGGRKAPTGEAATSTATTATFMALPHTHVKTESVVPGGLAQFLAFCFLAAHGRARGSYWCIGICIKERCGSGFNEEPTPPKKPLERGSCVALCATFSPCSLMNQIEVGDPAASSLSSCLRAFRGGFSLLTETGLLRPFLVSNVNDVTSQQGGSAAAETPVVAAATPVCLSKPSPGGSFPAGADVPVDHAWSQDGELLVVLRRSSYTAYARELDPSSLPRQRRPSADQGAEDASSRAEASPRTRPDDAAAAAPSLGLVEAHVGSNSLFDGKVVACCMLDPSTAAAGGSVCSGEGSKGGGGSSGQTYLIAVGGASGVECHALELGRREGFGGSAERERTGDATEDEGKPTTVVPVLALGASCRPLNNVFQGYPVVAVAFSPDSGVMAAAAMTGHVKVWEVDALAAPAPPAQQVARQARSSGGVAARKGPAPRGGRGGGKKKGFDKAFCGTRSRPGRAESSDLPALWGVAVRPGVPVCGGHVYL